MKTEYGIRIRRKDTENDGHIADCTTKTQSSLSNRSGPTVANMA
jgi:hypothetical protein